VWERKVCHLHYITALLTACPAGLPVQPQQALPAEQTAYHTRLATQDPEFRPAHHMICVFTQNMLYKLCSVSRSSAAKNDNSVTPRAQT